LSITIFFLLLSFSHYFQKCRVIASGWLLSTVFSCHLISCPDGQCSSCMPDVKQATTTDPAGTEKTQQVVSTAAALQFKAFF
jgi:hypothetical protein